MRPPPSSAPRRSRAGFSVVELLLVAFILGVGLLGLTALMAASLRAGGGSRQRDTAAYLAHNALESLAADGLASALLRSNGQAFPATAQVANAVDDAANAFELPDPGGIPRGTFDLEGRPSTAAPVFSVQWVRRAPKTAASLPTSGQQSSEILVNVTWTEAGPGGALLPKWLSFSRTIRH